MLTNNNAAPAVIKTSTTRWPMAMGIAAAVCCFFLSVSPVHAVIMYVNATGGPTGNTVNTLTSSQTDWFTSGGGNDNLWRLRNDAAAAFALGGDVWEANGPNSEDAPELTTTITWTPNPIYPIVDIYLVYEPNTITTWAIRGAIAGNPLVTYDKTTGVTIASNGTIDQRRVLLGVVPNTGSVSVNVDDLLASQSTGGDQRSWYDGVAFEEVPEPASLGLLLLGAPLLARRRR